jgi:CHAT domain-containing protein
MVRFEKDREMKPNYKQILLLAGIFSLLCLSHSYAEGLVREYFVSFNKYASRAEDFLSKGDYPSALQMYEQSAGLYEKENNELGVLFCLVRMGWLKRELGEYADALLLLRKAHPIGVRLHGDAAEIDASLGNVYMFSGDSEKAKKHYHQALDTLKDFEFKTYYSSIPNKKEMFNMFRKCKAIIHARDSLGVLHYFSGEYVAALEHLSLAASLIEKIKRVSDNPDYNVYFRLDYDIYNGIGYCETLMGALYGELGQLDKAKQHFSIGLEAFKEGRRYFGELFNRSLKLRTEFKSSDMDIDSKKIKEYESFLNDVDTLGATDIAWRFCYEIASELIKEKKYPQARAYLARAIETLELTRSRLREDTVKKTFAASVQDVYSAMINLLFEMHEIGEGFAYLERSKARAFLDILAGRSLKAKKTLDNGLVEKEIQTQQKIDELLRSLNTTLGPKREVIYKEYKRLLSEHKADLDAIKDKSLEFATTASVATVPAEKIAARIAEGSVLVSYFVSEKRMLIWTVRRDGIKAVPVDISASSLAGLVRQYRAAMTQRQTANILALGSQLYDLLISPVKKELTGAKKLLIVPTGMLHYLPFSGLNVSGEHFLAQDFIISILPNASSIYYLDKEVTQDLTHILAVGNPRLKDAGLSLKFAEEEIKAICKDFPHKAVLTGTQALESVFRQKDIIDIGVIHIAAHGEFNVQDPLKSALLLVGDDQYDGNLETFEIYSLTMNPRLVVLSACESGIGEIENGDEVQSLNRAFLYAGAGSVVASLWNVNDLVTAVLMEQFYKNLEIMDKAQALRMAQLKVQQISDYSSPYYWAAFYLIGD